MTKKHPYPHQLKYRITPADYTALRTRLSAAALEEGRSVHTLLFDSYRGRVPALTSGDAGLDIPADPRFSLHYFDDDPTYLLLERRQDQRSDGTMVTEAECRALLAGETDWLLDRRNPVLRDFHSSLTRRMLLPRVLLSYQREVYALEELDLWVALDTDIRTTLQHMDFLDPDLLARDTAGLTGQMLMEISYSSVIPDDILPSGGDRPAAEAAGVRHSAHRDGRHGHSVPAVSFRGKTKPSRRSANVRRRGSAGGPDQAPALFAAPAGKPPCPPPDFVVYYL